jgi:hypothetical protein
MTSIVFVALLCLPLDPILAPNAVVVQTLAGQPPAEVTVEVGQRVTVPVTVKNPADNVIKFSAQMRYCSEYVEFLGVRTGDLPGAVTAISRAALTGDGAPKRLSIEFTFYEPTVVASDTGFPAIYLDFRAKAPSRSKIPIDAATVYVPGGAVPHNKYVRSTPTELVIVPAAEPAP